MPLRRWWARMRMGLAQPHWQVCPLASSTATHSETESSSRVTQTRPSSRSRGSEVSVLGPVDYSQVVTLLVH